jgi:nicotinate-nucleotide adenylyltransferase
LKLGILGGSFNPVHLGHLFLADKALTALKLDRVVIVPAYLSPFKLEVEGMKSSANDRIEMLAAAIAGDSRFAIDDCEIIREGVSYTVDTLEDIISRYNITGKPSLIIGDDLAEDFPKWRDSEKILQLADVVVVRRANAVGCIYPFPHTLIDNEVMSISSQMVRQKICDGSDWRSLVPSAVRAIIEDKQLYGFSGGTAVEDCLQAVILRIETAVRETLNTARFLHSRNTALLAMDLCRRFNLDPMAGYLAGIAHDLGKQLDVKLMMKLAKTDGMEISILQKDKPNLLHGRAAAVLLRDRFCIHNKDILEAVAFHTSGSENMGPLAKVIYIADKAEVSRHIDPALRKMCYEENDNSETALDSLLFAVLKKTVSKLQSKKLDLSGDTLRLLDKMKERNN